MGRINILPAEIYNKISAGEVVERPASVVKELVENCIDAGASRVTINVDGGGIDYIEITDNGCGISEDDLETAFFNHATSKLLNIVDLDSLMTLGFRGEALASIASVSKIELTTRTPLAETGVRIKVEEGHIVEKEYCSANVGTRIVIRDLFYNTPARKKFLKTPAKEITEITQYITRLILTNPFLEVNYNVGDKNIYNYVGNSLEEAIFTIYGSECLQNCLPINSVYGKIVVKGYVGSTDYTKPNSTYQTASVNGRYVKDINISTAVKQAFAPHLMTRNYPFFVLDIQLPPDQVDVNVHPNKMEVRFTNVRQLFYAVSAPIKQALNKYAEQKLNQTLMTTAPAENTEITENVLNTPPKETPRDMYTAEEKVSIQRNQAHNTPDADGYTYIDLNNPEEYNALAKNLDSLCVADMLKELEEEKKQEEALKQIEPELHAHWEAILNSDSSYLVFDEDGEIKRFAPKTREERALDNMKFLGILFKTYFVVEVDDNLVLIDQHAAHERILYDKYMLNENRYTQELLVPYVFKANHEESQFIEENLDVLSNAGFVIKPFGNDTFIIKEVCNILIDTDLSKFVHDLLAMIDNGELDDKQLFKEKIAKKACRRAVKAGETLTDLQVEYIIRMLLQNKVVQCPHGRPITITLTHADIDKMFKRIV